MTTAAGAAGAVVIPWVAPLALAMSDAAWARLAVLKMLARIKKLIERGELL